MMLKKSSDNNPDITLKSALKYFDIKIGVYDPGTFKAQKGSTLTTSVGNCKLIPMTLSRVLHTSDAAPGECSIGMSSPTFTTYGNKDASKVDTATDYPSIKDITLYDQTTIPKIGDEIAVFITDIKQGDSELEDGDYKVLFKGFIIDTACHRGREGVHIVYNCQDMKGRLMDQVIRKSYNETYLTSSFPNFSGKDADKLAPYISQTWTVKQIIEDIISTAKLAEKDFITSCEDIIFFDTTDFDYNGLNELEGFIPQSLRFDNDTILEAIYRTISSAGSYRMIYDQSRDKIVFVRMSIDASACGPERKLVYAAGLTSGDYASYVPLTGEKTDGVVNVISDNTVRKTSNIASIFKMYSAPIEWYSGHFQIKNLGTAYDLDRNDNSKYLIPDRNWDGYPYFKGLFSIDKDLMTNTADDVYQIVGCPLYPAWDPKSGYEPYKVEAKKAKAVTYNKYGQIELPMEDYTYLDGDKVSGKVYENQGITINDKMFSSSRSFANVINQNDYNRASGYTYEAWMPNQAKCRFCEGSGAVAENSVNTVDVFGTTIKADGTVKTDTGISLSPFDFGFSVVKQPSILPSGAMVPTKHPVPWKNTCPVCRGVGMEPWFKITNIMSSLVDVGPNELKLKDVVVLSGTKTVSGSDVLQQKDRSWGEVASDTAYSYGPKILVETSTNFAAVRKPADTSSTDFTSMPYHPMADSKTLTGNKKYIFETTGVAKEADPMKRIDSLFFTQISINNACSIDSKRGNVIFKDKVFVSCRKPIRNIKMINRSDLKETYMEKVKSDSNATAYHGQGDFDGFAIRTPSFWRPSRAWITCYFTREKYYDKLSTSVQEITRKVELDGDKTEVAKYKAFAGIEDNRYVLKVTAAAKNEGEFTVRPVIKAQSMDSARWQIHPWDMKKWMVPASSSEYDLIVPNSYSDDMWGIKGLFPKLKTALYFFSEGTVHVMEGLRKNEKDSIDTANKETTSTLNLALRSDTYGKTPRWVHRDDRIKLMDKAVMELEKRNDIQINGTIVIKGSLLDYNKDTALTTSLDYNIAKNSASQPTSGFGYVVFPDESKKTTDTEVPEGGVIKTATTIKASIVKIEYVFAGSFTIELEVGTEVFRLGEKKETEQDYQRLLSTKINELYHKNTSSHGGSMSDHKSSNSSANIDPSNIIVGGD